MQDEYDFTEAERGKFYRDEAVFKLPADRDDDVGEEPN